MRLLIFLLPLLFLSCAKNEPEKIVVTKKETIILKPPKELLDDDISIPEFYNKNLFIHSSPIRREMYLTNYIIDLLNTIKLYKIKNKKILKWYKEINKIKENTRAGK